MKKSVVILIAVMLAVFFSLAFTVATADTGRIGFPNKIVKNHGVVEAGSASSIFADAYTMPTFNLPPALQVIEDEAFEGTAIVAVDLPETLESIGERAFANITSLRIVKIPMRTELIAKNAFAGSNQAMISDAPGSFAEDFARENGLPFAPISVMVANVGGQHISGSVAAEKGSDDEYEIIEEIDNGDQVKLCCRSVDEMKADLLDQFIAHTIAGRAPPIVG